MTAKLEVRGVSYSYHSLEGETLDLSDISFSVESGQFLSIVGPSGCGKSTLLSLLCGLLLPDQGEILLDGAPLSRDMSTVGYMLQKDHLFEWRTILSNVSLGLEIQKRMDSDSLKTLREMLNTYGLKGFNTLNPQSFPVGCARGPLSSELWL